jgi:hypothetical protein
LVLRATAFEESLCCVEFYRDERQRVSVRALGEPQIAPELEPEESVYRALVLGVRDYVNKHQFPGVVMGLSGGIDSALTLAIAVDALGPERVQVVMMPSRYTSQMSRDDAQQQAHTLGVAYSVITIEGMFAATLAALDEQFAGRKRHSADMLAVLLDMIISMHGSAPVYVILLDVSKAFDRTWREAIWAKMLAQGHPPQVVAWLRQAYHRLRTAVKSGDARSAYVDAMIGIGQGDTNSTHFFSLLLSDLPAHLHQTLHVGRIVSRRQILHHGARQQVHALGHHCDYGPQIVQPHVGQLRFPDADAAGILGPERQCGGAGAPGE